MATKNKIIIRLERDGADHLLPKHFFDIIMNRFLPVLSLTYISSVLAIAAEKGRFIHFLFFDNTVYLMALFIVLWVAIPGMIWIFLHGNPMLRHIADLWYKIIAGLLVLTIMLSFVLFPEANVYGLRLYFVLTIPVFIIMYVFFVRGGLPKIASYPLNALGFVFLMYGAYIKILF